MNRKETNNNATKIPSQQFLQEDWGIDGLGFLPGLCCPHHDRVQSNGILRSTDFEELLKRHPTERGICNFEWTLRVVNKHDYDGSDSILSMIFVMYVCHLLI